MASIDPLLGSISMFAGNFAPRGWALCQGQLLQISQNTALFSLLGTTYGGDGRTTFALPDLRGRAPISSGSGPGLSDRRLGSRSGQEAHTLTTLEMPSHNHFAQEPAAGIPLGTKPITATATVHVDTTSSTTNPTNTFLSQDSGTQIYGNRPDAVMNPGAVTVEGNVDLGNINVPAPTILPTGGSQSHNNMQPYLTINYIIALVGSFPSRS